MVRHEIRLKEQNMTVMEVPKMARKLYAIAKLVLETLKPQEALEYS